MLNASNWMPGGCIGLACTQYTGQISTRCAVGTRIAAADMQTSKLQFLS